MRVRLMFARSEPAVLGESTAVNQGKQSTLTEPNKACFP